MTKRGTLDRREFLKLAGLAILAWPGRRWLSSELGSAQWPSLPWEQLPSKLRSFLRLVPASQINEQGKLILLGRGEKSLGEVPLAQTQWNIDHSHAWDRLDSGGKWGLVLHWFGDRDENSHTLTSYLWGFNGLRWVDDYLTRTSAHFLVGSAPPVNADSASVEPIGILQTQVPDTDGWPFVASQIQPLDYQAHHNHEQYFVRALYQLGYKEATIHSILQDFFDGPRRDPNMCTLAVEITGYDFENPAHIPNEQQIANVISVVWAIMQRYSIRSSDILGHNEITPGKPDPGKKFMALIRLLIGAKALVENEQGMKELVFGQHLCNGREPWQAICTYFQFVRDYLLMVSYPSEVYEWESRSAYWFLNDQLKNAVPDAPLIKTICLPFRGAEPGKAATFLIPSNHEGVDYIHSGPVTDSLAGVHLISDGVCLFKGVSQAFHNGMQTIFRHRQPDGAEILSVYGHLDTLADLQVGLPYPMGTRLGTALTTQNHERLLHFAIAYGGTWETDLSKNPDVPLNAGPSWIRARYQDPVLYLNERLLAQEELPLEWIDQIRSFRN